jgi:hypothetical protein
LGQLGRILVGGEELFGLVGMELKLQR